MVLRNTSQIPLSHCLKPVIGFTCFPSHLESNPNVSLGSTIPRMGCGPLLLSQHSASHLPGHSASLLSVPGTCLGRCTTCAICLDTCFLSFSQLSPPHSALHSKVAFLGQFSKIKPLPPSHSLFHHSALLGSHETVSFFIFLFTIAFPQLECKLP